MKRTKNISFGVTKNLINALPYFSIFDFLAIFTACVGFVEVVKRAVVLVERGHITEDDAKMYLLGYLEKNYKIQ